MISIWISMSPKVSHKYEYFWMLYPQCWKPIFLQILLSSVNQKDYFLCQTQSIPFDEWGLTQHPAVCSLICWDRSTCYPLCPLKCKVYVGSLVIAFCTHLTVVTTWSQQIYVTEILKHHISTNSASSANNLSSNYLDLAVYRSIWGPRSDLLSISFILYYNSYNLSLMILDFSS